MTDDTIAYVLGWASVVIALALLSTIAVAVVVAVFEVVVKGRR